MIKPALAILAVTFAFAPAAQAAPAPAKTPQVTHAKKKKHRTVKATSSALVCRTRTYLC